MSLWHFRCPFSLVPHSPHFQGIWSGTEVSGSFHGVCLSFFLFTSLLCAPGTALVFVLEGADTLHFIYVFGMVPTHPRSSTRCWGGRSISKAYSLGHRGWPLDGHRGWSLDGNTTYLQARELWRHFGGFWKEKPPFSSIITTRGEVSRSGEARLWEIHRRGGWTYRQKAEMESPWWKTETLDLWWTVLSCGLKFYPNLDLPRDLFMEATNPPPFKFYLELGVLSLATENVWFVFPMW